MKFIQTNIKDLFIINKKNINDDRGSFSRLFCKDMFKEIKFSDEFVQINHAYNKFSGTLRGMHFQLGSSAETKLIKCIRGSIYDVVIDLRKNSKTYLEYFALELNSSDENMLFVPKGFAHGYITLEENTEIIYFVTNFYNKDMESGIRYDDPKINIQWPVKIKHISKKDESWNFL